MVSVTLLLSKHKNAEQSLDLAGKTLDDLEAQGQQLQQEKIPGKFILKLLEELFDASVIF